MNNETKDPDNPSKKIGLNREPSIKLPIIIRRVTTKKASRQPNQTRANNVTNCESPMRPPGISCGRYNSKLNRINPIVIITVSINTFCNLEV